MGGPTISMQPRFAFAPELIVDLFAGGVGSDGVPA